MRFFYAVFLLKIFKTDENVIVCFFVHNYFNYKLFIRLICDFETNIKPVCAKCTLTLRKWLLSLRKINKSATQALARVLSCGL